MRIRHALVGLLAVVGTSAVGCHRGVIDGHDPWGAGQGRLAYNLPPAERIMEPGPGVGGPGPGVIPPVDGSMGMMGGGMMGGGMAQPAAYYGGGGGGGCGCSGGSCGIGGGCGMGMAGFATSQIAFIGGDGVMINWDVSGQAMFDSVPLVVPGRQDFLQGGIYRLRLSNLPGRAGVELFPTLEVAPVTPRTDAFLAHSPIPVQFTEEDFDQALSGNFVTKVIYLPDPEFQELSLSGVETLVSTRLDPGMDPIAEADRRGSILAVVRIGNKDLRSVAGMASGPGGVVHASYQQPARSPNRMPNEVAFDEYEGGAYAPAEADGMYPTDANAAGNAYGNAYGGGYGGSADGIAAGGGYGGQMPMGMPTAGFAPAAVPPNMMAGGPNWGMPITGTPIGLPGPPHVPLGSPAGLQRHVMKNRTRVVIPPPVTKMTMSVKQRPGMNYPRPVNRVTVDEVHREPGGLFPNLFGWFGGGDHQ
jgi:hypothetical protein